MNRPLFPKAQSNRLWIKSSLACCKARILRKAIAVGGGRHGKAQPRLRWVGLRSWSAPFTHSLQRIHLIRSISFPLRFSIPCTIVCWTSSHLGGGSGPLLSTGPVWFTVMCVAALACFVRVDSSRSLARRTVAEAVTRLASVRSRPRFVLMGHWPAPVARTQKRCVTCSLLVVTHPSREGLGCFRHR